MKWIETFVKSAGFILLISALGRFLIGVGNASVLSLPDPALGIPLRYASLMVGGIELLVALICLFGKKIRFQIGWLAWLTTNYVVFQIGLLLMHCHPQVTCVGSLTDPLHLSRGMIGFIMQLIPVYFVLGSYAVLFWLGINVRAAQLRNRAAEFLKISCHACGGHIQFSAQNLGQKIPCPHCQTVITLRKPENLKMSCFFCKEHIEFPNHALSEKIKCPHCSMDITLKEPA